MITPYIFERTVFSFTIVFINTTIDIVVSYRFTQRNLLRIYPKGTRLDSSNYDPMIGWMHGAQMVAFNMQVRLSFFLTLIKKKHFLKHFKKTKYLTIENGKVCGVV